MSLLPQPNRIKVCLVAISLGKGGADRSCALLSRMLHDQGFDVHIAILNDQIEFPYSGKLLNLGKLKSDKDSLLKRFLRLRKLKQYLKKEGITHVIDHRAKNNYKREVFYKNYVYKGIKTIYVVHSFKLETYFGSDPKEFKELYAGNFKNVAVSEGIKTRLQNELGLSNLVKIYNPIDSDWVEKAKEKVALPNKKYILSYGRIDDDVKDLSFLIRSYHESQLWKQQIKLVMMGEGKDEQKLKNLAEEFSLAEHIDLLPFTSNPFPFIANAHVVALTSKWEGFPMALVESLSLGIPVVSLDINSGPSEIIIHKKNGLLISEREPTVFASALRKIFNDEILYAECKTNAAASVSKFSKEIITETWTKLLTNE
jgi:glycosyltransferase involved in cell wall biosynthesis